MGRAGCAADFTGQRSAKPPPERPPKIELLAISPSVSRRTAPSKSRNRILRAAGAPAKQRGPVYSLRMSPTAAFAAAAPKRPSLESAVGSPKGPPLIPDSPCDPRGQTARLTDRSDRWNHFRHEAADFFQNAPAPGVIYRKPGGQAGPSGSHRLGPTGSWLPS